MLFRRGFSIRQVARLKREPAHLLAECILPRLPASCQARRGFRPLLLKNTVKKLDCDTLERRRDQKPLKLLI